MNNYELALYHISQARPGLEGLKEQFHHEVWYGAFSQTLDRLDALKECKSFKDAVVLGQVYCKQIQAAIDALTNMKENRVTVADLMDVYRPMYKASDAFEDVLSELEIPEEYEAATA